jgi:uncharacterized repeat protein (TIGR01451 family)
MKRLNPIDSMLCKYPSILMSLVFTTTAVLPLMQSAIAVTAPLTITNTTLTGFIPVGTEAIYQVTVKNTSSSTLYNVKITDTLPSGFKYGKELSIFTKGAVVPTVGTTGYVKPLLNDTNPTWNNYNIPSGGIITVVFTATTSSTTPLGKVSNLVNVTYKNSAGGATQTAVVDNGSATVDDVTVKATPPQPILPNADRSTTAESFTPTNYCGGKPGAEGIATDITGIVNTYFKPTVQSVPAGSTAGISIAADAAKGKVKKFDDLPLNSVTNPPIDIKKGDLLLIIQMQDASITNANNDTYGSGSSTNQGSGQSSMGNTGLYEYAFAASDISSATGGGTLMLTKPLVNSYVSSDITKNTAGATIAGQKRFQVIRVPQYASVTVKGTLYASPWDGNVGGVLAVDTFGKFYLNNQRMSANSTGFRGGFGLKNGGPNAIADYAKLTSIYTVDASSKRVLLNSDGSAQSITNERTAGSGKGEGTAGTPRFISTQSEGVVDPATGAPTWNGGSTDNIIEGYPGGDTGRGAPANAGGAGNFHNAGGGGGGNGGIGGQGGLSWSNGTTNTDKDTGGRPGFRSSLSKPVPWQLIMGGGGGGGDANNSPQGVPGGAGGGIVMLRAGEIVGSGQIYANGRDGDRGAYSGSPDGAGGAGAGGTVLIQSRNASTANLTIQAKGGNGGSSEQDAFIRYTGSPVTLANQAAGESVGYNADGYKYDNTPHGPGGGGAGGVVLYNVGAGATINAVVTGGLAGQTDDKMPGVSTLTPAQNLANAAKGGKTSNPHGATAGSSGVETPFSNSEDPFNALNNKTDCSPNLVMTNTAVTSTVRQGEIAKYKIRVENKGAIGTAVNVSIDNPLLPTGFTYLKTDKVDLQTGSTRPTESIPTANSTTPTWGEFTIPPSGVVEITYQVKVKSTVKVGKYDNSAHTSYPDPTRDASNPNAVIEDNYDGTAPTAKDDDVTIIKGKSEMVWDLSPSIRIVRR